MDLNTVLTCLGNCPAENNARQLALFLYETVSHNTKKMTEEQKWKYIEDLNDELLKGGVILSEWTTFQAKDAEIAFCSGAYLSSILSGQAAIESHLRFDHLNENDLKRLSFFVLINKSCLPEKLKEELHQLRKFRNKWIHANDPDEDDDLLSRSKYYENELAEFAKVTMKNMLKTLCFNPMV